MKATIEESKKVAAKAIQQYINPYKQKTIYKPIHLQLLEINGKQEFQKGLYHNLHYENLINELNLTRNSFRESKDINERKKMATKEINLWNEYLNKRKKELPKEFILQDRMKYNLKDVWDFIKSREEKNVTPDKMIEFHHEYAKSFKFEVPIEGRCLCQMIHPHMGYLSHMPMSISFDDLLEIYMTKLVASYEKSLGQDLLGNEISSLAYWNQFDKKFYGFMSFQQFTNFMKTFRFSLRPEKSFIMKEFKFALKFHQGEFSKDIAEEEDIVRFDFYRYIFLERNF